MRGLPTLRGNKSGATTRNASVEARLEEGGRLVRQISVFEGVFFGLVVTVTSTTISRTASAATIMTPFGPADDSCVHETPNGGSIDVQTGDVNVNGVIVDHYVACTTSSFKLQYGEQQSASGSPPTASGGWYEYSSANATTIGGLTQFNNLTVYWDVPTAPAIYDSSFQYFFPSLQSGGGTCGPETGIIQPVLQWGNDGYFGGQNWEIASWAVWGCTSSCTNCSFGHSPPETVSPGDEIGGDISQTAGDPDSWKIEATDFTSGADTWLTWTNIPNSWPKFSSAQMAVLEAYYLSPTSCDELSSQNSLLFRLEGLGEAGPSWINQNDELGLINFTFYSNPSSLSPKCSFDSSGTSLDTKLTWKE